MSFDMQSQAKINSAKQRFFVTNNFKDSDIPEVIRQSWIRSKSAGVEPYIKMMPPSANTRKESLSISTYLYYLLEGNLEYYEKKHCLLSELNAAVFYLDSALTCFSKAGNSELIYQLKNKNIGIGTSFSEGKMGTNSAVIAAMTKKNAWVIGSEHYLNMLNEYACISRVSQVDDRESTSYFYSLYIVPCTKLTPMVEASLNYIISSDQILSIQQTASNFTLIKNLLSVHIDQTKSAFLLLNPAGQIIYANSTFYEAFKTSLLKIGGRYINEAIPELSNALIYLNNQQAVSMEEVVFENITNHSNRYFMECIPIINDKRILGLSITLTNARYYQKHINKFIEKEAYFTFDNLIGKSLSFCQLKESAAQAAKSASNILILGESGTGKELFAQAIHNASDRANKPFIAVNCAAIPRELVGSELFGYEEGAFTGARKGGAVGKFEQANEGTLFLDEIAEMPLEIQSVLLRVLETRLVTPLGSARKIPIDVHLITATNRNLLNYVNEGKFRLDLFYRINVIRLDIMPLRERLDDLPLLVSYFITDISESSHKEIKTVAPEVMELFAKYPWQGNIRELRNVLERAVNKSQGNVITISDISLDQPISGLSSNITNSLYQSPEILTEKIAPADKYINRVNSDYKEYEANEIKRLMKNFNNNKSAVAKELGIARSTLYAKLKEIY